MNMTNWQKIAVGALAAIVWIATIVVGFLYPTLAGPMAEIKIAAIGVLNSVGIYHLVVKQPATDDAASPQAPPASPPPITPDTVTAPTSVTYRP